MSNSYIYCFIRKDLPIVQQIIQVGHACHEAGMQEGLRNTPNIVLFEVQDHKELLKVSDYLFFNNIHFEKFIEPDINSESTAICTEIIRNSSMREIFKDFTLYK